MSSGMNYGKHGRCEATAKSTGERCGRPAVGEHGKCDFHGGLSPKGRDQPQFKHGLFSDHLDPEDQRVVEILRETETAEKLAEVIDWRLARLRRAVAALSERADVDADTFWDAFADVVEKTESVEAEEIRELANMLDRGNRAMQQEVDLVRKLIRDYHKMTEGETKTHEAGESWRDLLAGGGSDE